MRGSVIRSPRVSPLACRQLREAPRRRLFAVLTLAGVALAGSDLGCEKGPRALPAAETAGVVVARVGSVPITAAQVAAQMARTGLGARQALDQRITFEVLAQSAAGQQSTPTPAEVAAQKKVEVERLVEREIEPQLRPENIPDADVRALYQRGKGRFVHGRLVQATVLCLFTGARMNAERRARVEGSAKALAAYLDAHPARTSGELEALAKEPQWADRQVSVTTVWQDQDADQPFPPVVGHALAGLHKPGDRTPLIGDETGYYIATYVAEEPPLNQSFEEAAPTLRAEMYQPWRRQRFLRLTMDLSAGHDIEVFPDNLKLTER